MSNDKAVTKIENMNLRRSEDLCKLAELIGYGDKWGQLQCNNGAFVSSLLAFFDDNPGAMEAVQTFIIENIDSYELSDELTEDDGEGEDEEEEDDSEG